ncbi:MAG TPA: hypothetical protein GX738_01545 [Firmicutes bacterium]|nr:hypothetical protein [Bacillota bacterium]
MNISTDIWTWIAALGTIAMFSFIFKENPVYRWCEHLYVGAAAGYAISVNVKSIADKAWMPLTQDGKIVLLIPIIFGILLYARFIKSIAWLSRWPMSFLVGVGSGLAIFGVVNSQLLQQIKATLLPLNSINNIIMVFGVLSILLYFFFSMEHRGVIKHGASVGRWIMMITFGVSFGNVVMGRISLLLGAMEKILGSWLGLI